MTGVAKNTIVKLLVELGTACEVFHDRTTRGLTCKRVQVDEIWSFVYCKNRNVPNDKLLPIGSSQYHRGAGDVRTWTTIDADTELAVSWLIGGRDAGYGRAFMNDIASRLANRVQLTSDGLNRSSQDGNWPIDWRLFAGVGVYAAMLVFQAHKALLYNKCPH